MKRQFSDPQLNFLVGINVLILVAATVLSHGDFLDVYNFQSMASQLPELALLAIGVSLAMIAGNGGIDLSGLGMANLAGVVAATVVPLLVDADATPWGYTGMFVVVALVTGLLGGLTTFSTFSAEIVQQLTRQQYGAALLGVALHLFGSLLLTALGLYTYRLLRFGA